ncbi:ATP-binding protein [Thalassospira lucentensis]|uniref:ATP-binding protein n=1 Tax=Thalassospira lucentensis TaxID=168935 RepID=UPI003D2C4B06
MTSLKPNLIKRIERLPKPNNVAAAMLPVFEAISNSIHSTQAKFSDDVSKLGFVNVEVSTDRKKTDIWITVEDNGEGLNAKNWEAFTTTDTDNKISIGGKGVGRLLWLDCFTDISVSSIFEENDSFYNRSFGFQLSNEDQIIGLDVKDAPSAKGTSFYVKFSTPKYNGYFENFPGRGNFVFQHLTSHFLPTFIGGKCPKVTVTVGDEVRDYPEAISDVVYKTDAEIEISNETYGTLYLTLMECDKVASADLKGHHFVHFIAHDRTVHSQSIDGKLGIKYFGDNNDRVFHAILKGDYLDKNVNQERTSFIFEDVVIDRIINEVCFDHIYDFLKEPLSLLKSEQQTKIKLITQSYPSVEFGSIDELQGKLPSGELHDDAIFGHLSRERFRRDQKQAEKIRAVLKRLKGGESNTEEFFAAISEASKAIEEAEQKSLAEYIVRRKVVLDFIEKLLEKVRDSEADSSYQREDVLHSFICPMRVKTLESGDKKVETAASHDLWIVDERLTFAQYFSSDVEFSKLSEKYSSEERPDLLIFDYVHGLRSSQDRSRILLIEFKRPGRKNYGNDENPQHQVERYVRQLKSGKLNDVKGRPIKLDDNTIFYCFIVADIVGKLDEWTYSWQQTADGRGRIYRPNNGFLGSIELMGWDSLLLDAKERNQAFFDKAGISGESYFSSLD